MAFGNARILAPADGSELTNQIVRPRISCRWDAGTGPYTIDYTWDDDATFGDANGRRQTAQNTGVSGVVDSAVPSADLGLLTDGTVWYLKVVVTDTGAGGPPTSTDSDNEFTYRDPDEPARTYLYLLNNVGVGFLDYDEPLEKQIVGNGATSGTFTLSFSGQGPTSSLTWDDSAADVKSALEALSNITEVAVRKYMDNGASPGHGWEIIFVDVTPDPIPLLTASDSLTGGSTVISAAIDDSDPWGPNTGQTDGPDGDAVEDFRRYLYLLTNVGVGFHPTDEPTIGWGTGAGGTEGPDGDTRDDFHRYLYLLKNVDSTQPCPFLFSLSVSTVRQTESLVIYGQGLVSADDPTDAYTAEVRLYDSPSFGASYSVLTKSTWDAGETQDSITVTVPQGTTSGYVAVVHTVGATCSGSNFIFLNVIQVEPDREAGWWVEAWDLENSTRIISPIPNPIAAGFEHIANDIGKGYLMLSADHPDINDIIDRETSPPVRRLVKIYQHNRFVYSFVPDDVDEEYAEDGAKLARIYGEGQESILRWGRALWQDLSFGSPTESSTWIYGSDENALSNGDMEPNSVLDNGGIEDGIANNWDPLGSGTLLYTTTSSPQAGGFALRVIPTVLNGGTKVEFSVEDGFRTYLDVWVKDPLGSGDDITVDVLDSDGTTVLATQTLQILTALWTPVTLTWVPSASGGTETNTLRVRFTDTVSTPHEFQVDSAAVYTRPDFDITLTRCTVGLSRDYVGEGLHSLKVEPNSGSDTSYNGFLTTFDVAQNRDYTMTLAVTGTAGEEALFTLRLGGAIDYIQHAFTGLGTWDIITLQGTTRDEVKGRFTITGKESAAMTFYVDDIKIAPGQPATPAGGIVGDVHTAMSARGALDFITLTFTSALDSSGNPWPENLPMAIDPQWNLWDILEKMIGFGYDVQFAPQNWRDGGDTGWELSMWGPLGGGFNYDQPDAPVVLPGPAIEDVKPSRSLPPATVVYAEGAEGIWTVAEASAAIQNAVGRIEEFIVNRSAQEPVTLARNAQHRLDVSLNRGQQFTARFNQHDDPLPYFDFAPLDRLRAHLPSDPNHGDREAVTDATYRVAAITWQGTQEIMKYEVDFGRYKLHAQRIRDLVLSRMLRRRSTEMYQPGAGSVAYEDRG